MQVDAAQAHTAAPMRKSKKIKGIKRGEGRIELERQERKMKAEEKREDGKRKRAVKVTGRLLKFLLHFDVIG